MFKLQRLEISGFKSFADSTEIVFTGSGITAVVGPNGCGKSNVSDAIAWVLGEQRAKSLRGGEMKDVIFAGTKDRKPGGMAEVVLHLVRDDSFELSDEGELEDIDETLGEIDDSAVDMAEIEGIVEEPEVLDAEVITEATAEVSDDSATEEIETVKVMAVGSAIPLETKVKTKRHWRPRSFALDFAPGEAVSVTRRLYLSGESEYQLNGKTCRLRDIQDLFSGTGLSGAHYAIIEQGRIGQILSAKPADRRSLIEEAAGISKFRARQRAAETRLESAKSNLARIFDIVSEVETRVNSLRRQAAKTRRFKILQEEFRELLKQLYAAEGKHLAGLSEELKQLLVVAGQHETELGEQVAAKEEASREATTAARTAEESLAQIRQIHSNNALERDRAEREHHYKSDQIVGLNNRSEALRGEIATSEGRLKLLAVELERLGQDEERESAEHARAEATLREAEDAHRQESGALAAIEESINELRNELTRHTAAVERFDEIGRQASNSLERLQSRAAGLALESRRADDTLATNHRNAETLGENLAVEETKLAGFNTEKDGLIAATTDARGTLRAAELRLAELTEEHSAKKHRLATLTELEEKRAVYTPQVQRIFAEQESIGVTLGGVLADRLNVAPEAERAVEALFGPFLEAVVVDSLSDAKRLSAWLTTNDVGRTAMIILPGAGGKREGRTATGATIAESLGASENVATALRAIFPREMSARLVTDLDTGSTNGETIVNFVGEMLVGGRLFIGGSGEAAASNESLLAFKRELFELGADTDKLAADIERVTAEVDAARATLVDLESKTVDLQSLIIKVDRGIHGLQIQVHGAHEEITRAERHRKVVADEAAQVAAEIDEITGKRTEAKGGKESAEAARIESTSELERIAGDLSVARGKAEAASIVLNERRMVAATSDERRRAAASALRRVENEVKDIEARVAVQRLELQDAESKIHALHEEVAGITDRLTGASDEIARENEEITTAVTALTAARGAADASIDELAELNRKAAEARNARAEIEIRQAEAVTELKNITEQCQHELNISLPELVESQTISEEFVLDDARPKAEDLRQRLENFGAINMLALEELAESEERHIFLTSQREDIIQSIAATEEALREIKKRSRERFRTAFEAINANFTQFFQDMFGGGQGQMTLLEADDILEAGIEVIAQPPGKRLQNIMLLSGGEKAMTAIALVLAIFKYRPSPFCLLDEVDAPLDEANVGRFAAKVEEMSEKTQFIVITHNKRTMESAKALYGVTMQEAGVSKVVSVKFE
jgi:chromosome segregation protein